MEQLNRLVENVVNASSLAPSLKALLIARLQPLVGGFDPGVPSRRQAVCVALNVFRGSVQALS